MTLAALVVFFGCCFALPILVRGFVIQLARRKGWRL
jgi:hypothetical protein